MPSKLSNLQSALAARPRPASAANDAPPLTPAAPAAGRQSNRVGKVNLAAWVDEGFKASLRLVQARRPGTLQELIEEALNDLFAKYDAPQVVKADRPER